MMDCFMDCYCVCVSVCEIECERKTTKGEWGVGSFRAVKINVFIFASNLKY